MAGNSSDELDLIRNQSRAFWLAFDRCMEQRPLPEGQFQWLVVPAIVCAAFSMELGLKALIVAGGRKQPGHKLAELFSELPADRQAAIVGVAGMHRLDFDRELIAASNAFVEWRYIHEKPNASANLEFHRRFGGAIQKALAAV